jgi:hypothetical protein
VVFVLHPDADAMGGERLERLESRVTAERGGERETRTDALAGGDDVIESDRCLHVVSFEAC